MSTANVEKILAIYKRLAQIPSFASAIIAPTKNNSILLKSVWSQKNLERKTTQKFYQEYTLNADLVPLQESFPSDVSTELLTVYSKDETLKAVLRAVTIDGKPKQFIEVWDQQHCSKSYDLSAFDVHGDIYAERTFSSFHISSDNSRLLYVAEKKLPKNEPFYKQKPKKKDDKKEKSEEEEPSKGTEYVYKPDWGEQLVGKHRSVIVILNLKEDTIVPLDSIPDDYFPAQVLWAPNGSDIVGVAYKIKTRYLGLYACNNRESYIFHLKGTEFNKLTLEGYFCSSPRFSPDEKNLIWYERKISPAHNNVMRLMHLKWGSEKPEILIDEVSTSIAIANDNKFYGIYVENLPKRCWSDDSKYIFFSTPQRSNIKSYGLNLETKVITEIDCPDGSSLSVVDVNKNFIAFVKSSVIKPQQLLISKFDFEKINSGTLTMTECSKPVDVLEGENIMYEHTEVVLSNSDAVKDFNFTFIGKKSSSNKSVPLIAVSHGGPCANYCNTFIDRYALFALSGFGIVQINYRGSTGRGGDNVDFLLGKVGKVDIEDCVTAIDETLKKYPWLDPEKVNLYGGSHGGFINAHLSGQYPDKFKSVVLLNPVTDIAGMFTVTDIPDWCRAVSGLNAILEIFPEKSDKEENYSEIIMKMLQHSPVIHVNKVKTPTLVAIGSKDLRVPMSQGKVWYDRLVQNNVPAKLFLYEDNHSLSKEDVDIDVELNSLLWFLEHNGVILS